MSEPWTRYLQDALSNLTLDRSEPLLARDAFAQEERKRAAEARANANEGRANGGRPESPLTLEQQQLYDAALADASATPEQLRAAFAAAGMPAIVNLDRIMADRDSGRGFAPGRTAQWRQATAPDQEGLSGVTSDDTPGPYNRGGALNPYQESKVGQGMSGVNENLAWTLGLPVDAFTGALNTAGSGLNWVAENVAGAAPETALPMIESPVLGSEWFTDKMDGWAIYEPTDDPGAQFWRRVGQSVGGAVVPVGGVANTARGAVGGLLAAVGGGTAAAASQQLLPGNVAAEAAAEVVGSAGTSLGLLAAGRRQAQKAAAANVPTVDQLKRQERELYRTAETRRRNATPTKTRQLAREVRTTLRQQGRVSPTGRISEVYPKTREAMQLVQDYSGQTMTPTQVQALRSVIADGLTSPEPQERRTASLLLDTFDMWAAPLAREFPAARDIANRYLNAESLEQARKRAMAEVRKPSGSAYADALRTQYHLLDPNDLLGRDRVIDDLTGAIRDVAHGTPGWKTAQAVGQFAPDKPGNKILSTAFPGVLGTWLVGPAEGAAAAVAVPTLGQVGSAVANRIGMNNAARAELIARHGGALPTVPLMDPEAERLALALLAGQAASKRTTDGEPAQTEPGPFAWRKYTQPRRSLFGGL